MSDDTWKFWYKFVLPDHGQREQGKVIGVGVYVYVCGQSGSASHQIYTKRFPHRVNKVFSYIMYISKDDTIMVAQTHR